MPIYELYFLKGFRNWILKKLRRAANIKTFHEIKNFLFTCFFCFDHSFGF